jgi:hypothetical protein
LGVERVPKPTNQFDAFVGREFVNYQGASRHEFSLINGQCPRNDRFCAALTETRSAAWHQ